MESLTAMKKAVLDSRAATTFSAGVENINGRLRNKMEAVHLEVDKETSRLNTKARKFAERLQKEQVEIQAKAGELASAGVDSYASFISIDQIEKWFALAGEHGESVGRIQSEAIFEFDLL